jgi:uncharacterized protein YutE (UPF0331/DUF86 family)
VSLSILVATQEALDVAFHVAADAGFGAPASNAEAFALLARHGVLPEDLARALVGVATVRNRIVHGYTTLDLDRFWREVPAGLDALERFTEAIARFAARG